MWQKWYSELMGAFLHRHSTVQPVQVYTYFTMLPCTIAHHTHHLLLHGSVAEVVNLTGTGSIGQYDL